MDHIAQGLDFIHGEHYTHRDLKPPNSKVPEQLTAG
jgi:serine/threonine protein kinase